ncbi:MAG TPA: hypothetical protein VF331_02390 [Polyangiales bacterium]
MHYVGTCTSAIIALGLTTSCAASAGTKPHDMSTAQHEAAAQHEEASAVQQERLAQTDVKTEAQRDAEAAAWASTEDPSEQHKADAASHRELAAKHRAASQALRDVEARACVGISESDRDMSPFYHREDITAVAQAQRSAVHARHEQAVPGGGRVVFRAVPGMTVEWLQRLVNCHLARAAAVGYSMPEMSYCPLMLKGVSAAVSSTDGGFAVEVTSDDPSTAAEIWRRVRALKP